jgi:hypothetical protein
MRHSKVVWTAMVAIGVAALGCSSKRKIEDYTPSPAQARAALEEVLEAWKQGRAVKPIDESGERRLEAVDRYRLPGQRLDDYEIYGEVTGSGGRWFGVRLQHSNPTGQRECRYVVVGIDPLWVYQELDYQMLSHWDHPMEAKIKTAR